VFLFGSLFRFDREQYTWKSGSSQLLRRSQLRWGSNLFHVGILVIFAGHFVGLLTPIRVFDMLGVSHGFKQGLAIVVGGLAGVACFIGITLLAHRRFFDPRIRATSSFGDIAVLLILWVQLTLGLATIFVSLNHMDGHEMVKFMNWAQGILTLQPSAAIAFRGIATPLTVTGGMATRSGDGAVPTGAGPCSCGCACVAARAAPWLMTRLAIFHSTGWRTARRAVKRVRTTW
jgi:respiratory nitrate reductase gamma subunit